MSVWPYLLDMHVITAEQRRVRIWLPLFLLWPLLLALVILSMTLTLLADIVLLVIGSRYHSYTLLLLGCFEALAQLRGTDIHIHADNANVDMTIK